VSFSIILPSLQPYLSRNGAGAYFYGLTVAIYSVGEMIGAVAFGKVYESLTVRYEGGAKTTLLMCIGLGIIGSSLYVAGDIFGSPYMIMWGRMLQGLWTGGKQVVEQTYLSETAPPDRVTELTSELGTFAILGFVCGPSFGALFTSIDVNLGNGLVLDAYTAPGWFILALCVVIFGVVCVSFQPEPAPSFEGSKAGGGLGKLGGERDHAFERSYTMDSGGAGSGSGGGGTDVLAPPNEKGLTVLLLLFIIHFFSFAVQETITTPFVLQAYGWTQRDVNLLFVGVGIVSLVTSVGVKYATRCVDDYHLLITSLLVGLFGSLVLIDSFPGWGGPQVLPAGRFFLGFTLITVAFPFGRNVSLSVFSQILGPTPQGEWFGWMFAAGAVPRIIGPSWSLYALDVACKLEHMDCFLGGRTWLEFSVTGGLFAVGVAAAMAYKKDLKPYGE
jgi:MFS family permease